MHFKFDWGNIMTMNEASLFRIKSAYLDSDTVFPANQYRQLIHQLILEIERLSAANIVLASKFEHNYCNHD